jgi:ABC-type enterochelin transport system permease subunit
MNEERLMRALAAPVTPAKDMHFALLVMRRAEAARFRAETTRGALRAAGLAALAAAALLPLSGWLAENVDVALDAALAVGGLAAIGVTMGAMRCRAPARR